MRWGPISSVGLARVVSILASVVLAWTAGVAAQASPTLPLGHPTYRDLEVLVSTGLVRAGSLGSPPYARATFARAAREARLRVEAGRVGVPGRVTEALRRLESRFEKELAGPAPPGAGAAPAVTPTFTLRSAGVDASWADSPDRAVVSRYAPGDFIDASLNPLRQRNRGVVLGDGVTVGAGVWLDAQLGRRFVAQVEPRAWVAEDGEGSAAFDASLRRASVRSLFGNLSVEVGRDYLAHGSARAYGPVFSDSPRGFDMIRLSTERPARLPWLLRYLGPSDFAVGVADMGGDREFPHSKLIVFDGVFRPHRNVEWGWALLNHQMGEGAPDATLGQRLRDILFLENRRFLPFDPIPPISDKALASDVRLTIPSLGTQLYAEFMTTDDHNLFSDVATGLGTEAVWTTGFRVMALGSEGRWDLWGEVGRNGVRPYTHHQFTSGMTLDRRIIGSPLGPLAGGVTGGVEWMGPADHVAWSGSWERYQGDQYQDADTSEATYWIRIADNPDEVRIRTTLDWTRESGATGVRTTLLLGYEHVTRFAFTEEKRHNFLARMSVGYAW